MRDVGLCIVYRNNNYGSILQSYATLLELESLGCKYEIICYNPRKNVLFYLKALPRLLNRDMIYGKVRSLKRKVSKTIHKQYRINDAARSKKFRTFVDKNFRFFSEPIHDFFELQSYSNRFTDVIVGSDQLWLPSGLSTNFYNLMFVPEHINKIAYSASFGVSQIPLYQEKRTKQYLNRINHISVREESGAKIIKQLTGREVEVILDPTMIINRSVWDENIPDKNIIGEEYIFCYFLGNNPSQREEVKKLSKEKGIKIVSLKHLDEYIPSDESFGDISPYDVGPIEFVNLIRHAKYVCTDSFHGSVFSIIYHKLFISFNRYSDGKNSRNSRLDTLFSNIGISRRYNNNILEEIDRIIDYDKVDANLEALRKRSTEFIKNSLSN